MFVKLQLSSPNSFRDMSAVPNLHLGAVCPRMHPNEKIFISEKCTRRYLNMRKISTFWL